MCTLQPLKSGHLTNKDTFFCPKDVRIREVPLYWTSWYIKPASQQVALHVHITGLLTPYYVQNNNDDNTVTGHNVMHDHAMHRTVAASAPIVMLVKTVISVLLYMYSAVIDQCYQCYYT